VRVLQGTSPRPDGATAVAEATATWQGEPDVVFAFCSATQDADAVGHALAERFPGVPIAGCTTSGEHLTGKHLRHSLVVAGLVDSGVAWATRRVQRLGDVDDDRAEAVAEELFAAVGADPEEDDPDHLFALLFIDGLSMQEERITALLDSALRGVAMAGGSAGDDLAFQQTQVIDRDGAASDALVLVIGKPESTRVRIVKHQHFTPTDRHMVITRAIPEERRVVEIDGYPALSAYAHALGMPPEEVTSEVSFLHPVTFRYQGELYVRSIQAIHDDGSLSFYCAVEEGMVLDVGGHDEMAPALSRDLEAVRNELGHVDFVLGFNCILRALESDGAGEHETIGEVFRSTCDAMVGFDTYGEQLHGLHMNQTLVAVALSAAEEAA